MISRDEVLRYLMYKGRGADGPVLSMIEEGIKECEDTARPLYVYRIFDIGPEPDGIHLTGANICFKGESIWGHLKDAPRCAVMAVTLGAGIDRAIMRYEKANMAKAVILDACASAMTESVCDRVEENIRAEAGCKTNFRFSPGYGDFSLDIQREIIGLLDAYRKIGLVATDSSILVPRKSVTAVIGLFDHDRGINIKKECGVCDLKGTCAFVHD